MNKHTDAIKRVIAKSINRGATFAAIENYKMELLTVWKNEDMKNFITNMKNEGVKA